MALCDLCRCNARQLAGNNVVDRVCEQQLASYSYSWFCLVCLASNWSLIVLDSIKWTENPLATNSHHWWTEAVFLIWNKWIQDWKMDSIGSSGIHSTFLLQSSEDHQNLNAAVEKKLISKSVW